MPIIDVKNISKEYKNGNTTIFANKAITFSIEKG